MSVQVVANANQEFCGITNGALPEKTYDIFCKAQLHKADREHDNIRPNYLAESCAIRLKDRNCPIGDDCPRFKGPKSKRKAYIYTAAANATMKAAMKKRTKECAGCHEVKWIYCNGFCRLCHEEMKVSK